MKNKEKYAEKIVEIACSGHKIAICRETKEPIDCMEVLCKKCDFNMVCSSSYVDRINKWAEQEYVEYETDWNKVPVDTPILVKLSKDDADIFKRHFCKYENNKVFCWNDGRTSFSVADKSCYTYWNYTELANEEDKIKYRKIEG